MFTFESSKFELWFNSNKEKPYFKSFTKWSLLWSNKKIISFLGKYFPSKQTVSLSTRNKYRNTINLSTRNTEINNTVFFFFLLWEQFTTKKKQPSRSKKKYVTVLKNPKILTWNKFKPLSNFLKPLIWSKFLPKLHHRENYINIYISICKNT